MLLAGDVGGTNVDLGIFRSDGGPRAPLARAEFKSAGRLLPVLERMPVHVVLARAALIGAATAGLRPDHHH